MTVRHGGGCGDHEYKLEVGACMETFPVRCGFAIVATTSFGNSFDNRRETSLAYSDVSFAGAYA